MNVSGPAVLSAWRTFVADHAASRQHGDGDGDGDGRLKLVILHDEMEIPCGKLRVKRGCGGV